MLVLQATTVEQKGLGTRLYSTYTQKEATQVVVSPIAVDTFKI